MQRHSESGGVPAFSIAGRMVSQRERLMGMTDEERRWRAQYLKDQYLIPEEPRFSPEYYAATNNIFRRIFRYPRGVVSNLIRPVFGTHTRIGTSIIMTSLKLILFVMGARYYLLYNGNDWTRRQGVIVASSRPVYLPGDPEYSNLPVKQPYEYYDAGFSESPLCPFNKQE